MGSATAKLLKAFIQMAARAKARTALFAEAVAVKTHSVIKFVN